MYKLYWAKGSGAMAPQALFEEIGAEYEKIVIDFEKAEHKTHGFLSVNPMGQIPALILPDGTLMTETAAMLLQIVDRHPEAQLAPPAGSGERARFLRWIFFLASNVYPAILRIYYSERYSPDPSAVEGIWSRRDLPSREPGGSTKKPDWASRGQPEEEGAAFAAPDVSIDPREIDPGDAGVEHDEGYTGSLRISAAAL
jgi:glutathione S-transferase